MTVYRVTAQSLPRGITEVLAIDAASKAEAIAQARARFDGAFGVQTVYLAREVSTPEMLTLHPSDLEVGDVLYGHPVVGIDRLPDGAVVATFANGDREALRGEWELHRPPLQA